MDRDHLIAALYVEIDAYQRTARPPGLQHAQIRQDLAERLADGLLPELPTAAPTDPDEIAEQLEAIREMVDDTTLITPGSLIHGTYRFLLDEIARLQAAVPSVPADAERAAIGGRPACCRSRAGPRVTSASEMPSPSA
ncbi:hypothetical protein RB200_19660 [Streptomyces sp. PmtG]